MRFKRCYSWQIGPFETWWRCILRRRHEGRCFYEPDLWNAQHEMERR